MTRFALFRFGKSRNLLRSLQASILRKVCSRLASSSHGTSKMPPRKEIKEQVVYAASKRKAPPFKPLRPSTLPRVSTTESESSNRKTSTKPPPPKRRKPTELNDDDDEGEGIRPSGQDSDASEDLPADPLAKPSKAINRPTPKRKPARHVSPMSISSEEASARQQEELDLDPPPGPSQSDAIPTIPQPLLVRLLHEHFADKTTKIDKNAIQVLQKYFEVFIRETIARAALQKRQDAEGSGDIDGLDVSWLELEDLEKVAGGMMLDF